MDYFTCRVPSDEKERVFFFPLVGPVSGGFVALSFNGDGELAGGSLVDLIGVLVLVVFHYPLQQFEMNYCSRQYQPQSTA